MKNGKGKSFFERKSFMKEGAIIYILFMLHLVKGNRRPMLWNVVLKLIRRSLGGYCNLIVRIVLGWVRAAEA